MRGAEGASSGAGSVRDWVSHAAGLKYGALYSSLPAKAGTKGCGRTLCALLTALDVANGMKLLHKYKILHSDLKPHNVLLVSSHTVCLPLCLARDALPHPEPKFHFASLRYSSFAVPCDAGNCVRGTVSGPHLLICIPAHCVTVLSC